MICGEVGKATESHKAAAGATEIRCCIPCYARITAAPAAPDPAPAGKESRRKPLKCKGCHTGIATRIINDGGRRHEYCDRCYAVMSPAKDQKPKLTCKMPGCEKAASHIIQRTKMQPMPVCPECCPKYRVGEETLLRCEEDGCKEAAAFIKVYSTVQRLFCRGCWASKYAALQRFSDEAEEIRPASEPDEDDGG